MRSAPKVLREPDNVLFRIQRALAGYISYLAASLIRKPTVVICAIAAFGFSGCDNGKDVFEKAESSFNSGDIQDAEEGYKEYIVQYPTQKWRTLAEQQLAKCKQLAALTKQAEEHMSSNQFSEARTVYKQIEETNSKAIKIEEIMANIDLAEEEFSKQERARIEQAQRQAEMEKAARVAEMNAYKSQMGKIYAVICDAAVKFEELNIQTNGQFIKLAGNRPFMTDTSYRIAQLKVVESAASGIRLLEQVRTTVEPALKGLTPPPSEYATAYEKLVTFWSVFFQYAKYATQPASNSSAHVSEVNKYTEQYVAARNQVTPWIPLP
jgi:hypothetical protein